MNVVRAPHLQAVPLPHGWTYSGPGFFGSFRHYQEVRDNLGRSLSLITAPEGDEGHQQWLRAEAQVLSSLNHPSIPAPYALWEAAPSGGVEVRPPTAYVRRWIVGESLRQHQARGMRDVQTLIRTCRLAASALSSVHDLGRTHGAVGPEAFWLTPSGRLWIVSWQWAVGPDVIPDGLQPDPTSVPWAPEWDDTGWHPTPQSDQWQLAASLVESWIQAPLPQDAGERLDQLLPEFPASFRRILATALHREPTQRFPTLLILIRELERKVGAPGKLLVTGTGEHATEMTLEAKLRRVTADDYEVISALGEGAHGSVWRVRDLTLGRYVALKVLRPSLMADPEAFMRFTREARMAAELVHPGIVPIFDMETREGVQWYTMELAENGSLADLVRRQGPRPAHEIGSHVERILGALAAAHGAGVVHRDLKPENILIDRWGAWRIGDFGIAGTEHEGTSNATPGFAPPEQLLGEGSTSQSDLWAFGAVCWFTLTGEAPLSGSPEAQVAQALGQTFRGSERLPDAVRPWLLRLMAGQPADRFASAAEALQGWRDIALGRGRGGAPLMEQLFPTFSRPFRRGA